MYGHQGNAGTLSHVISINYQKRKFPFISNHVQEPNLYKADGLHSDVMNLELQGFYDSFYSFQIPLSRVVGSQVMIGWALAYYGSSRICLVFLYLLLVSLRLFEARRKSQNTSYYGHVSIARFTDNYFHRSDF